MFNYAVILIALGAAVGLYMAVQHFRGRTPPRGMVAATHGLLAVSGVIVLLIAARESGLRGAGPWRCGCSASRPSAGSISRRSTWTRSGCRTASSSCMR